MNEGQSFRGEDLDGLLSLAVAVLLAVRRSAKPSSPLCMLGSLCRSAPATALALSRARLCRFSTLSRLSSRKMATAATATTAGTPSTLQDSLQRLATPFASPSVPLPEHLRSNYNHLDPAVLPPGKPLPALRSAYFLTVCTQDMRLSQAQTMPRL
jgi:hypothetical protein